MIATEKRKTAGAAADEIPLPDGTQRAILPAAERWLVYSHQPEAVRSS